MRLFTLILTLFIFFPAIAMAAENSMPATSTGTGGNASPVPVESAKPSEGNYTCPMHPHIHGQKGDRCPLCGMDLVPSVSEPPANTTPTGERKILYWYDPMVPEKKFDKPGKSPYMDMDLVPFYEEEGAKDKSGALTIEPAYRQALGVKTSPVQKYEFGHSIHTFGSIVPSTRTEYAIAVRTSGWISNLKTNAIGDIVKKGDLLFTYYSNDLMAAQVDYLLGKNIGDPGQRLRLYGMDDKAISELKAKGRFLEQTPFYAPSDGIVTTLNARQGSYINADDNMNTILTLQDFSQVWVESHVAIKDLQFLSLGTPALVTIDETGETYKATIDTIYPMTDMESRKGMIRLVLDNQSGKLKTGTLVNVMFDAENQSRLAVSDQAVLYGKDGGHVIADLGDGYFKPISVKTGISSNGMTEIVSGLKPGQSIVTAGQFMIDAESNLRGGASDMENSHAQ